MGQDLSKTDEIRQINDIENNYEFIKKFNDIRFGEVKLLQHKHTKANILQKDYTSYSTEDYKDYIQECKKRLNLNHPNIIKIYGYTSKKEDAFCANFFKIIFYFECFDHDLEQEIHGRRVNKELFPETEIWYMLDCIISAGAYFETNQAILGDIRPFNILITPSMDYKIVDREIFGKKSMPNYFGLMQGLDVKNHYLAPEIFKDMNNSRKPFKSTPKGDIFSLGMSMIEASNLENLESCYDWTKYTFNEKRLKAAIDKVRAHYGDNLANILTQMTHISEDERPDFRALDSIFSVRRSDIRARFIKKETIEESTERPERHTLKESGRKQASGEGAEHHHHETPANTLPIVESQQPFQASDDIDQRIREAIERTENTLAVASPGKFKPLAYAVNLFDSGLASQYYQDQSPQPNQFQFQQGNPHNFEEIGSPNSYPLNYSQYVYVPQSLIQLVEVEREEGERRDDQQQPIHQQRRHEEQGLKSSVGKSPQHGLQQQQQQQQQYSPQREEGNMNRISTSNEPNVSTATFKPNDYNNTGESGLKTIGNSELGRLLMKSEGLGYSPQGNDARYLPIDKTVGDSSTPVYYPNTGVNASNNINNNNNPDTSRSDFDKYLDTFNKFLQSKEPDQVNSPDQSPLALNSKSDNLRRNSPSDNIKARY